MTADQLFSFANLFVLLGWVALAVLPLWKKADHFIVGIVIALLSALYAYLLDTTMSLADFAGFGSLKGINSLFQNPYTLLAGWVHYLAFDLMTGLFMVRNAQKHKIPHLLALVCCVFTFMAGPVGLLLYIIIRAIRTRNYFAENFSSRA